ncbi:MAG: DUF1858 domain-containing protein [Dehalococcoidia bacterium]|nr:DUF1858 domain-containing protein [Dehalococcoidia bacterium]
MAAITKDMIISQTVALYPGLMRVLEEYGMGCSYCMGSMDETIEGGARMHGVDLNVLLEALNQASDSEGAAD